MIKHFDKYPLITFKLADYLLFKEVVGMIKLKEHLTKDGLDKIVAIKASINRGLPQSEEFKTAFPHVIPVNRPLVTLPALETKKIFDPNWLAGFTSPSPWGCGPKGGEGCFILNLFKSSAYKTRFKVQLRFQITQHYREEVLFRSLIEYFGCGNVYFREGAELLII